MDFITILGRLLLDGKLRDEFALSPAAFIARHEASDADGAALLMLSPEDLEFQSVILLRKRFEKIQGLLPRTLAQMGENAFPVFIKYARSLPPRGGKDEIEEALGYCLHCARHFPGAAVRSELNRLKFACGSGRISVCFARDLWVDGRKRNGLQLFFRLGEGRRRESVLYW